MIVRKLFLVLLFVSIFNLAWGQEGNERFVFNSVTEADEIIEKAKLELLRLEQEHLQQQRTCYDKFFVTNCLDKTEEDFLRSKRAQETAIREAQWYLREQDQLVRQQRLQDKQLEAKQEDSKAAQRVETRIIKENELKERLASLPTPAEEAEKERIFKQKQQAAAEAKKSQQQRKADSELRRAERIQKRQAAMDEARREMLKNSK